MHLLSQDELYFLREHRSGLGYTYSQTNNLIDNFKPAARDRRAGTGSSPGGRRLPARHSSAKLARMKGYLGVLMSFVVAGCSNAPTTYFCYVPGSSCIEFRDGWTPEDAMDSCGSASASFGDGVCPNGGGLGVCTVTVGTQTTAVYYYSGFGDGTEAYALMNCDFIGGAFTPL